MRAHFFLSRLAGAPELGCHNYRVMGYYVVMAAGVPELGRAREREYSYGPIWLWPTQPWPCIVMALYSFGLHRYGLSSHGPT